MRIKSLMGHLFSSGMILYKRASSQRLIFWDAIANNLQDTLLISDLFVALSLRA